jgi:hypothetical protein
VTITTIITETTVGAEEVVATDGTMDETAHIHPLVEEGSHRHEVAAEIGRPSEVAMIVLRLSRLSPAWLA